ncbi:MAG: hypothetical protein ACREFW_10310 [Rhizomicrobium sp.]
MKVLLFLLICLVPAEAAAQGLAPMALNGFSRPPADIISAPVENLRGRAIGRVGGVTTDARGKPETLTVDTSKGAMVVAASAASYDQAHHLVVADIPARQAANNSRH